jgi:hypothetical protein
MNINIHFSKSRFIKLFSFLGIMILISCKNSSQNNSNSATALSATNDSVQIEAYKDSILRKISNQSLTSDEEAELRLINEREKEKEEMKNFYGQGYRSGNEIEITDSKILYDANFKAYLVAKVRNNLTIPFIAFEILVIPASSPNTECKGLTIKKKLLINPGKTVTINEGLNNNSDKCNFDNASVSLGDCIMGNGKKLVMDDIFRNVKGVGD